VDFKNVARVLFGGDDHIVLQVNAAFGETGTAGRVEPEGGVVFAGGSGGEFEGLESEEIGEGESAMRGVADDDDGFEKIEVLARDLENKVSEGIVNDGDTCASIVEKEFVFVGAEKGVDGNGDRADLDGGEEGAGEFGNVGEKEEDAFFHADVESMTKGVAETIDAFGELRIGDRLVATLDGDTICTTFAKMAVDEIIGGIEARLILSVGGGHGERV
jgi:hypothetical protein